MSQMGQNATWKEGPLLAQGGRLRVDCHNRARAQRRVADKQPIGVMSLFLFRSKGRSSLMR